MAEFMCGRFIELRAGIKVRAEVELEIPGTSRAISHPGTLNLGAQLARNLLAPKLLEVVEAATIALAAILEEDLRAPASLRIAT